MVAIKHDSGCLHDCVVKSTHVARDVRQAIFDREVAGMPSVSPRIGETPCSWHAVLTMVEAGEGLSLVPACVQHLRPNDVVFRPLKQRGCRLDAMIVWRRGEANAFVGSFLALLRRRASY